MYKRQFQILALIPGVSRAGITMTAARFLNFNRVDSGKISFLLSIPALAGASFLGLKDIQNETLEINLLVIIAIVLSFLFSYITVKFFLNYLNKFSLNIFVIYRLIIALILFSVINLNTPKQARLKAKGSFELVGFSSIPKKPTKLSILSAIATLIEIFSFGTFPVGPSGK